MGLAAMYGLNGMLLVCLSSLVADILIYCARFYVMYGIFLFLFLLIVIVCFLCAAFVAK